MSLRIRVAKEPTKGLIASLVHAREAAGRAVALKDLGEVQLGGTDRGRQRLLLCLGPRDKVRTDTFRCAGGLLARWLIKHEIRRLAVDLREGPASSDAARTSAFLEGLVLGSFRFDRRKSSTSKSAEVAVDCLLAGKAAQGRAALDRVVAICEGVNLARDVAHEPPNVVLPTSLVRIARRLARVQGLRCRVYDENDLARMKAGAILAVGQGSDAPPRMIVLEHAVRPAPKGGDRRGGGRSRGSHAPVVLIGKAITFDTGGYSLKDRSGMVGMKYDKCGGTAILGIMQAAAALRLKTPVVGIIVAAENMISGGAYRPNDIITTLSGKTVEIISADAEGRLVLADALTYAQQRYAPRCVIDLATLTGGVLVALGTLRAGLMGNDDRLLEDLMACGERTHERLWKLPLDDEYFDLIAGDDSDFKNSAERAAHASVGGIFLKQFVDRRVPWAHLDIAATANTDKDLPYCPKGATGFGVRLLVEYLLTLETETGRAGRKAGTP